MFRFLVWFCFELNAIQSQYVEKHIYIRKKTNQQTHTLNFQLSFPSLAFLAARGITLRCQREESWPSHCTHNKFLSFFSSPLRYNSLFPPTEKGVKVNNVHEVPRRGHTGCQKPSNLTQAASLLLVTASVTSLGDFWLDGFHTAFLCRGNVITGQNEP